MALVSSGLMQTVVPAGVLVAVLVVYLRRFAAPGRWVAVALGVCLLDQAAKALVLRHFLAGQHYFERLALLGGWVQICYAQNRGFGFGGSSSYLLVITAICAVALLVLGRRLLRIGYRMSALTETGCALLAGGLLGILLDRVRLGYVVDFLEFGRGANFTYNIADLVGFAGLALLAARGIQFSVAQRARRIGLREPVWDGAPPARPGENAALSSEPIRRERARPAKWTQWVWTPAMVLATAVLLALLWRVGGDEESRVPALHRAALHGDLVAVERLLDRGVDVNGRWNGWTPLHHAALGGKTHVAEILLAKGADVNATDRYGWTPLHGALFHREPKVAALLLSHGARVTDATRKPSESLLSLAVTHGNAQVTALLLAKGADPNAASKSGVPRIVWAVRVAADVETVRVLLAAGADVNARATDGRTPLIAAVVQGDGDRVRFLIEKGADVNAKGPEGWTALHYAAAKGPVKVVEALLAASADVNARNDDGATPLRLAKSNEMIALLRRHAGKR
jgi:ankyrin repeat protein/lipoprotein signal peptidase